MRLFILFTTSCFISIQAFAQDTNVMVENVEIEKGSTHFSVFNYPIRDVLGDFILGTEFNLSEQWTIGPTASFHFRGSDDLAENGRGYGIGIQGSFFPAGSSYDGFFVSMAIRGSEINYRDSSFWADRKKETVEGELSVGKQWIWSAPFLRLGVHWINQVEKESRQYVFVDGRKTDASENSIENILGLSFMAGYRF